MMFCQILCKKYGNDININIQLNDVFWFHKEIMDKVNNSR